MKANLDIGETSQHWIDMINAGNFYFEDRGEYSYQYYIVIYKNSFTGPILTVEANGSIYGRAYYKSWFFGRKIFVNQHNLSKELQGLIQEEFHKFHQRVSEEAALNRRINKRFEKST